MKRSILGLGLSFCMIANGCLSVRVEMFPATSSGAVSQEKENPQEVLQEVWKENSERKYTAEASSSQDAAQGSSKGSVTGKSTDVSSNAESAANYEETKLSISSATDFWNGCAVVGQNGKFGLINEAGQVLIDVITKYYHKFAKIIGDNKAKVVLAKLGNDAGIYGAARMVLK